jgi:ACS family hexuronate transporter-like MFS transporter
MVSRGAFSLGFWRSALGFGEAGNYPAGVKAVGEWFGDRDRAYAVGLFNFGVTFAAVAGPPVLVALTSAYGWRAAFALTSSTGFVWLLVWMLTWHDPPEQEFRPRGVTGWSEALRDRRTWGMAVLKFLTDGVWWFYIFWIPPYLYDARKFNLNQIGWALPAIYLIAGGGSIAGGWAAGYLIRRGWGMPAARRAVLGICALCMPIAAMAVLATSPVTAIALIGLATAAHQAWSSNMFTMPSDMFPRSLVASVFGIIGAAGGLGGFLFSAIIPAFVVPHFGYFPMFALAGVLHPLAWVLGCPLLWYKAALVEESGA